MSCLCSNCPICNGFLFHTRSRILGVQYDDRRHVHGKLHRTFGLQDWVFGIYLARITRNLEFSSLCYDRSLVNSDTIAFFERIHALMLNEPYVVIHCATSLTRLAGLRLRPPALVINWKSLLLFVGIFFSRVDRSCKACVKTSLSSSVSWAASRL